MPATSPRNENWRDALLTVAYPFDERSSLESAEVYLGTDTFLDASLYLKTAVQLPIYLQSITGLAGGSLGVVFADQSGAVCASGKTVEGDEHILLYSPQGQRTGLLLCYLPGIARLVNQLAGRAIVLLSEVATLVPGVVKVAAPADLRFLVAGADAYYGAPCLQPGAGMSWREVGGVFQLDIAPPAPAADVRSPVRSINSVALRTLWIAGHPQLNLRVGTSAAGITLTAAQDTAR